MRKTISYDFTISDGVVSITPKKGLAPVTKVRIEDIDNEISAARGYLRALLRAQGQYNAAQEKGATE